MWEVITALPQMLFLGIFYIMLVDIDGFYTKNPSTEASTYIFIFSKYSKGLANFIQSYITLQDQWLVNVYVFVY